MFSQYEFTFTTFTSCVINVHTQQMFHVNIVSVRKMQFPFIRHNLPNIKRSHTKIRRLHSQDAVNINNMCSSKHCIDHIHNMYSSKHYIVHIDNMYSYNVQFTYTICILTNNIQFTHTACIYPNNVQLTRTTKTTTNY